VHPSRTLSAVLLQDCHTERSNESLFETLHCGQGDNPGAPLSWRLV